MIYYFSGTGNSQWAAEKIGEKTGDTVVKIADVLRDSVEKIHIDKSQRFGLVFPVYAWNLPKPVAEFVELLDLDRDAFSYVVCTCGDDSGCTVDILKKHLHLKGGYTLKMPSNYIPMYDVDPPELALEKVRAASDKLNSICADINAGVGRFDYEKGKFAFLKSYVVAPLFNKYALSSEPFRSETTCNGCRLCERVCPTGNITFVDGMPFWDDKCVQCLACIHRCPKTAIQYGKSTKKRGRYYFDYTEEEINGTERI